MQVGIVALMGEYIWTPSTYHYRRVAMDKTKMPRPVLISREDSSPLLIIVCAYEKQYQNTMCSYSKTESQTRTILRLQDTVV